VDDLCTTDDIISLRAEILVARRASERTIARLDALLMRFPESADLWSLRARALELTGAPPDAVAAAYARAGALDRAR
jgi:predicted Zn-dependent protease